FTGFIGETEYQPSNKSSRLTPATRIDQMFTEGDVYITLTSPSVFYNSFKATALKGELFIKKRSLNLNKVFFKHAGGTMEIKGSLSRGGGTNPVNLKAQMKDINVP